MTRSGLIEHEDIKGLFLTREVVCLDENGDKAVMQFFTDAEGLLGTRNVSGTKYHRVEATHTWASGAKQTRWASGRFTYNSSNNTVSVTQAEGGVNGVSGITVSNAKVTTNSGTTLILGFGRAWREVQFSFNTKNAVGLTSSFSVRARVHSNGNS